MSTERKRIRWAPVIDEARRIVESYTTGVTLRQLFYRPVAAQILPNVIGAYKQLSAKTAEGRRDGTFPELSDRTRSIHTYRTFDSTAAALDWLARIYRRDRTENQDTSIYIAVEKSGMVNQLESWFGDLGLPILALGGYASQSYVNEIVRHVRAQGRPAMLIYAGDHDPSGWDIMRDFIERTNCWEHVRRVALDPELIERYQLPEAFDPETLAKLEDDPRAAQFVERFGRLTQVELDALPPDVLRSLYQDAIDQYWDTSTFDAVIEREDTERDELDDLAG